MLVALERSWKHSQTIEVYCQRWFNWNTWSLCVAMLPSVISLQDNPVCFPWHNLFSIVTHHCTSCKDTQLVDYFERFRYFSARKTSYIVHFEGCQTMKGYFHVPEEEVAVINVLSIKHLSHVSVLFFSLKLGQVHQSSKEKPNFIKTMLSQPSPL